MPSLQELLCIINVQHDCAQFSCKVTGTKQIEQEHVETNQTKCVIAHKEATQFILNLASLHNYQHLQEYLPEDYPLPRDFIDNHEGIRMAMAASLRDKKRQVREEKEAIEKERALGCLEKTSGSSNPFGADSASVGTAPIKPISQKSKQPKDLIV